MGMSTDPTENRLNEIAQQQTRTQVDLQAQRRMNQAAQQDNSIFRAVGAGLIGAAVAKTLFGNRGS